MRNHQHIRKNQTPSLRSYRPVSRWCSLEGCNCWMMRWKWAWWSGPFTQPIQMQADHLEEVIAGLVMANDVSAREVQISEEQQRSCLCSRDGYVVFVQA